jgi:hypothetical protein
MRGLTKLDELQNAIDTEHIVHFACLGSEIKTVLGQKLEFLSRPSQGTNTAWHLQCRNPECITHQNGGNNE